MQTLMKNVAGVLEVSLNVAHAFVPVRFRYYEPNKFSFRRWGYHDKLSWRGALPRTRSGRRLPMPEYRPTNSWSEKKAIFGQNDYIDILGDPEIHPVLISYNVPAWLRGFKGNEYQVLLRKRALFGDRLRRMSPDSFHSLQKNIKYQYTYLRYNQPQNMLPRGYSREN